MANEISLSGNLSITKSGFTGAGGANISITQAGNNNIAAVQTITTASMLIAISGITTPGYLLLKNMDATNFISVGTINPAVAATCQVTLKAGEIAIIPTRIAAWYAIADTASVDLLVVFFEL